MAGRGSEPSLVPESLIASGQDATPVKIIHWAARREVEVKMGDLDNKGD